MSHYIHARNTTEGLRFKIWSDSSDSYISKEMTEEELRAWTLREAINKMVSEYLRDIGTRIDRAVSQGTSSLMGDVRDLNGPWDPEGSLDPDDDPDDD